MNFNSPGRHSINESSIFRRMINEVLKQPSMKSSCLEDAGSHCSYGDIPEFILSIQKFFSDSQITAADCLALELNNSVRAALTVLAALDAGYSFMTLPVPGQGARVGKNVSAAARFCRWVVTVEVGNLATDIELARPTTYLQVAPNPNFDSTAKIPDQSEPRLFFRTSGSLGVAKLAMHSYGRFYKNAMNALKRRQFDPSHRIALPTPIFHLYGLGAGLLAGFAGGASIDLQERSNILKYLEREHVFQPNVAYVTPSFCETLIRGRRSPRPYKFMVTSGDRISDSAFKRCEDLHGPMVNQYGTTEMGVVSASELHMPYELRCHTVGRPVEGVEFRIVEIPHGSGANGESGELQIKHEYGFEGYVDLNGNPLKPEKSFDGEWYRTGDLASLGPEGTLMVQGRCDLSVNRNGVLLPLADVESRMRELAGIDEIAVAPGPDTIRGRALVAFCVLGRGVEMSGQKIRANYAEIAPAFSVPDLVCVLKAMPKLESGKIDRQALARLAEDALKTE